MTASTTPISAYGTAVTWHGHDIGFMTNISGPDIKMDTIDISSHDSTDDYREYVAGMLDGGDISIDVHFIPGNTTGQATFLTDLHARTEQEVVITLPDLSNWTFQALPTGMGPFTYNYDGSVETTLTMKVTGKPEFETS